jgi:hypothetical protein
MTKTLIILTLLISGELIKTSIPFEGTVRECWEKGDWVREELAVYQGPGPTQGWYLKDGTGIFIGIICE